MNSLYSHILLTDSGDQRKLKIDLLVQEQFGTTAIKGAFKLHFSPKTSRHPVFRAFLVFLRRLFVIRSDFVAQAPFIRAVKSFFENNFKQSDLHVRRIEYCRGNRPVPDGHRTVKFQ